MTVVPVSICKNCIKLILHAVSHRPMSWDQHEVLHQSRTQWDWGGTVSFQSQLVIMWEWMFWRNTSGDEDQEAESWSSSEGGTLDNHKFWRSWEKGPSQTSNRNHEPWSSSIKSRILSNIMKGHTKVTLNLDEDVLSTVQTSISPYTTLLPSSPGVHTHFRSFMWNSHTVTD